MDMKTLLALCLAACATTPTDSVRSAVQLPSCSTATPGDDIDDTAAVQGAIATRCCLGPGVHDIDTPPQPATGRRRYNMLTVATGQELCGAGSALTTLRFRGDAMAQDWRGIEVTGGSVHDIRVETGSLVGTVEQTHAIHVTGPAQGITIHDVTIDHPIRGAQAGGDCIDLVGYPGSLVRDVVVRDSVLERCDRGGVQAHSGVVGLTVERVQFMSTGDLDINSEGSGASSQWLIANNTFAGAPANQGGTAIALDLIDDVVVTGNVMARGVYLYSCTHCALVRNVIEQDSGVTAAAVIEAIKASNDLTIADNTIRRMAMQLTAPVIHIGPHGTARSESVRIVHNLIEQQTPADVLSVEGMSGLRFDDNDVQYTAAPATAAFGVRALGSGGASGTIVERVSMVGNRFAGPLTATVYVSGASNRHGVGAVHAAWNTSNVSGLRCGELAGIAGPLTLVYNSWTAGSCGVPSLPVTLP